MSREIRTPLNGILGFADIGLRNYDDTEKVRNALSKIILSGKRLLECHQRRARFFQK